MLLPCNAGRSLCSSAVNNKQCRVQGSSRRSGAGLASCLSSSPSWATSAAAGAAVQASPAGDRHPMRWMPGTHSGVACYALPGNCLGDQEGGMSKPQQEVTHVESGSTGAIRYGRRNLEQEAPAFDTAKEVKGFYFFDDSPRTLRYVDFPYFYDPECQLGGQLQGWLDVCASRVSRKCAPPLYINGLTKYGKSATLNAYLPAIIREHHAFGVGCSQELLIFRVNMADLFLEQGYVAMLRQFLGKLALWCEEVGLELNEKLDAAVIEACRDDSRVPTFKLEYLIVKVLCSIRTPTIFLVDELQAWFCPLQPGTNLEDPASNARNFWKNMTLESNPSILWAMTGSGMAMVYASLNLIPTAGTAVLSNQRQVSLPAVYSKDDLLCCAEQLREYLNSYVPSKLLPTPEELSAASETSIATMAAIASEWATELVRVAKEGKTPAFSDYAAEYLHDKLLPEGLADWSRTLPLLSPSDRTILLGLCDHTLGVEFHSLARGLVKHLKPYVEDVPGDLPRRFRLASPLHRLIIRVAIKEDGQLRGSGLEAIFKGDLSLGDDYVIMSKFAGHVSEGLAKGFPGFYAPLKTLLQGWADELQKTHPDHLLWCNLDWFKLVLESEHNNYTRSGGKNSKTAAEQFRSKLPTMSPMEVLAYYHRMVRNCLMHVKELKEEVGGDYIVQMLGMNDGDVKVIEAWPFAPAGLTPKDALHGYLQNIETSLAAAKSSLVSGSSDTESSNPDSSGSSTVHGGSIKKGSSAGEKGHNGRKPYGRKTKTVALGPPEIGGPYGAMLLRSGALSRWPRG